MKKLFLLSIVSIFITSISFAQKSKAPVIKTENDTISYSYGISLVKGGMMQYLYQTGVLGDAAQVNASYRAKIDGEADSEKKIVLKKELAFKIDSINKHNKANFPLFVKGLTEAMNIKADKLPYMKGMALGGQILDMIPMLNSRVFADNNHGEIGKELLFTGVLDALNDKEPVIENATDIIDQKVKNLQTQQAVKRNADLNEQYADVLKAGREFLAANAKRNGVISLPSGLQYEVITEGTGAKPSDTDRVKVHYTGTFIDGTVFDSSVERGEPIVLGVNQVIQGWTQALRMMPVGSKWKLYIPYELGYGSRMAGQIKPFSALVFDIELIDIEK